MSIGVELDDLRDAIDATDRAPYLLTVSDDGRPHCVAADWAWDGDELAVSVGNRTLANARARKPISLLWPPRERDGYSLIVDGDVTRTEGSGAGDNLVGVHPTRAVLHRPATGPTEAQCAADCVRLLQPPG
ncbi:MAG: hypothetical protein WEC34_06410 [Acidimicrobiia bacterium]